MVVLLGILLSTVHCVGSADQSGEPEMSPQDIENRTAQFLERLKFSEPKFTPQQIENMVKQYLKSFPDIDPRKYKLESLKFDYVENEYWAFYVCIDPSFAYLSHFSLKITNEVV